MPANDRNPSNARLPPKLINDRSVDVHRIVKWVIGTFGAMILTTLLILLLRSVINNYAFDQGAVQANTMNLPPWASTPMSWMVGAGFVLALPALVRLFTTGTVSRMDRWWLIAFAFGTLAVNFVSSYNTPKRHGCDEAEACFGSQGQPLRWYSTERNSRVVLWDKGGRHPTRNTPLLPITADVVARWEAQATLPGFTRNGEAGSAVKEGR